MGWNGRMRNWNFATGKAAFRTNNFDELMNAPGVADNSENPRGPGDNKVFESSNPGSNSGPRETIADAH